MKEHALQVSHIVVRIIASATLAILALSLVSDRYYPTISHTLVNSWLGTATIAWMTVFSLLLLPYVGLERRWARQLKIESNAVWIDAILATACLGLFLALALYGLTHYAMF